MRPPDAVPERQATDRVIMVRPARFTSNPQTAHSNRFQGSQSSSSAVSQQALLEFRQLASLLREHGVDVIVFDDTPTPHKPDAIFPNNWLSLHADGSVVLYPMLAENRRLERRDDIIAALSDRYGCEVTRTIDLSHREREGKFLEGTGSMVLDRVNRIAYACLSARTDAEVLTEFAVRLGYLPVTFEAFAFDVPVYHTNVVMAIGERFAVICLDALVPGHRDRVARMLESTGHQIIRITMAQMASFAGNLLELQGSSGRLVVLSETAARSLSPEQCSRLTEFGGRMLTAEISTIETLGGGSVRCMLAEVHLPRRRR